MAKQKTSKSKAFVATEGSPARLPPRSTLGVVGWMHKNLFRNKLDSAMTLVMLYVIYQLVVALIDWVWLDAVFFANSVDECRVKGSGACWAFISVRFEQFIYGFYPDDQRWRVHLVALFLLIALLPMVFDRLPGRKYLFAFGLAYPLVAYHVLVGGYFGLDEVSTKLFGGFMLTMIVGMTGIIFSLPIGVVLALARRSDMMFISVMSVVFIEFFRGVPLITLLFIASTMLSIFLPPNVDFDLLIRVLIMVTLFSSAYMAETIRGGLQALPKGQQEAADALGLGYWQSTFLIVLPQALKVSIPGIVNNFIGLFKDTTLVIVIGMLDPLGIGRAALADSTWRGLSNEVYIFVAVFFFVCCYAMSRYSLHLERKLDTGHKR